MTPLVGGHPATILRASSNDNLVGTSGQDVIVSLEGKDVIHALGGDDFICSGTDNDRVSIY